MFGCTDEEVTEIAEALGIRGVSMMIVDEYRLIEPVIDKHSTMKKQKLPTRKQPKA